MFCINIILIRYGIFTVLLSVFYKQISLLHKEEGHNFKLNLESLVTLLSIATKNTKMCINLTTERSPKASTELFIKMGLKFCLALRTGYMLYIACRLWSLSLVSGMKTYLRFVYSQFHIIRLDNKNKFLEQRICEYHFGKSDQIQT